MWKIAKALDGRTPLAAFQKTIGVRLDGPFVALAGKKVPADLGRWRSDPPELFTVAVGDTDGLHWGYVGRTLTELKVNRAKLPAMLDLPNLTRLELAETGLAELPAWVLEAKKLVGLALWNNKLERLPEAIGALKELTFLSLDHNRLKALPEAIGKLEQLCSLSLRENRLRALPASIVERRSTLRNLTLGKNPLVQDAEEGARLKKALKKAKIFWT